MYIGVKKWEARQWLDFLFISAFLTIHLIAAGYPILHWDSSRYLNGAILLAPTTRAPTLLCYLIRPLVIFMGAYGFAAFQILLLTYVLVSALKFFNQSFIPAIIAIAASAAGYFAICVMMDVYTAVGLLALFLILQADNDAFLYIIAALCYIAHYENLFLFPACIIIYLLAGNRGKLRSILLPIALVFIIPLLALMSANFMLIKESRFLLFSEFKYSPLAVRIMLDSPEIREAYIEKHPGSFIARNKDLYEEAIADIDPYSTFLWHLERGFIRSKDCPQESRDFVKFAFKNYKARLLKNSARNTYRFLIYPPLNKQLQNRQQIEDIVRGSVPGQLKYALNSLQYKGGLPRFKFDFLYSLYLYVVYPVILVFMLVSFADKKLRDSPYYRLVLFSAIILLVNAFIMSSFVNAISRYVLRVMLIPCLTVSLIAARYLREKALSLTRHL